MVEVGFGECIRVQKGNLGKGATQGRVSSKTWDAYASAL